MRFSSLSLFENDVELYFPEVTFSLGDRAPRLRGYRYIERDGGVDTIVERWGLEYAHMSIEHEHKMIGDWMRAQEWGAIVPSDCWGFVGTVRRLKVARNKLRDLVREAKEEDD